MAVQDSRRRERDIFLFQDTRRKQRVNLIHNVMDFDIFCNWFRVIFF